MSAAEAAGGATVELRPIGPADIEALFEYQADPVAVAMAQFPSRSREAHFAHWQRILLDPSGRTCAVLVDGRVAGSVVSFLLGGDRLVGYWLGREFWGRGVATRALAAFLALEPERPLHARVVRTNLGSRRVLEKCGFRAVGTEPMPAKPGQPADEEWIYRLDAPTTPEAP